MVDMTHNSNNRGSCHIIFWSILFLCFYNCFVIKRNNINLCIIFSSKYSCGICIYGLIYSSHNSKIHKLGYDLTGLYIQLLCKLTNCYVFCYANFLRNRNAFLFIIAFLFNDYIFFYFFFFFFI